MALAMHRNLLAVYPHILQRLAAVDGVKAVKEAGDLADLLAAQRDKRRVAPLDGAVYVVYGGSRPSGEAGGGRFQKERLSFTFAYCCHYRTGSPDLYQTGAVMAAIQTAFQGWDAGSDVAATPFYREASPPIEYNDGYAFYPISFYVDVVLAAS